MFKYPHTVSESAEFLRLALPQMSRHDAGFHPVTYALWYEYVAAINKPLRVAIDAACANGGKIDDAKAYALYQEFVAGIDDKTARQVSEGFQRVLIDMSASAAAAGDKAEQFGNAIEQWTDERTANIATAPSDPGLDRLLGNTRDMREAIGTLQARLENSQREIAALRVQVERAREDALADGLTGLVNRKGFDKALATCLAGSGPSSNGPSLLMTDIDHFKKINDNYGHLFGDKVLRAVAQILKDNVKGKDTAARYGGEEFVILLPDTPLRGAAVLAEHIRGTIESSRIRRADTRESLEKVTISIGVATYQTGEAPEKFLERADGALYAAKGSGRNRVSLAAN